MFLDPGPVSMIVRPPFPLVRLVVIPLAIAIVGALLTRSFVAAFTIPSGSMRPALEPGDHVLIVVYSWITVPRPLRGDVVVFRRPGRGNTAFVKRIVGVPGDVVTVIGGVVGVSGIAVGSEAGPEWKSRLSDGRIPAGKYCVVGDNQGDSIDSRHWGLLPESSIIGKAWLVYWSSIAFDSGGGGSRALARSLETNSNGTGKAATVSGVPRLIH